MKKKLQKMFYTFIITAMMFSVSVNAQIVYTDAIPDTTINTNGGVYELDLNNDGITDFNITDSTIAISRTCNGFAVTGINIYIRITPLGANEVGNDTTYPSALLLNSNIDSSSFKWKNNANQILTYKSWRCARGWYASYSGHWNGAIDKYIPLRLDVNSQKYYGWVRLNVATGAVSFTIKDYAYNSIPNQPIHAGETNPTGIIENSFASSINLFPNPATDKLTIALRSNNRKVEVTIADITGKIIYSIPIAIGTTDPDSYREQNVEVNTKDFAEGIYVVQVQSADIIETRKLVINK